MGLCIRYSVVFCSCHLAFCAGGTHLIGCCRTYQLLFWTQVNVDSRLLEVAAYYEAQVGVSGDQVTRRELRKKFILPEDIEVDDVVYNLRPDGVLRVEIFLKDTHEPYYRCSVTTEDVTGQVKGLAAD